MTRTLVSVATVLLGLSAGLFAAFSYAVMPGLRRTDDATFVSAMRAINGAILNPAFGLVFVGAGVAVAAGVAAAWGSDARSWLLAGLALYVLGAFVVTGVVNVPLNDSLEAGTDSADHLRATFEDRWVIANLVRSVLTTASFACLVIGSARL